MAQNDIYKSKEGYEQLVATLDTLCEKPKPKGHRKYYCKNAENIIYNGKEPCGSIGKIRYNPF